MRFCRTLNGKTGIKPCDTYADTSPRRCMHGEEQFQCHWHNIQTAGFYTRQENHSTLGFAVFFALVAKVGGCVYHHCDKNHGLWMGLRIESPAGNESHIGDSRRGGMEINVAPRVIVQG
jgi:hypothetical protein